MPHLLSPTRAVVSDGPTETWYLRAGTGPAVLLLSADAGAREALLRALAAQGRVTAPEPPSWLVDGRAPPGAETVATWLRGFLDGTGITPAAIVADPSFATAAHDLALAEDHPVSVLVVSNGSLDPARVRALLA